MRPPGTLSVVATPIGNLEDLTFRALRTLKETDLIAAEDTRRTSKLLAHYQISKPLVSLHEHNEHRAAASIVARIASGENVALVSDAGTPAISDPGAHLVRLAREAGVRVTPIPGPSAITAALSVAGLATTEFVFMGFPPASGAARRRWLETLGTEARAVVFFEAPHRVGRTLREAKLYLAKRQIYVCREITKINETLTEWHNDAIGSGSSDIGEHVIVVSGLNLAENTVNQAQASHSHGLDTLSYLTNNEIAQIDSLVEAIETASALSPARIRNYLKKSKLAHKRRNLMT